MPFSRSITSTVLLLCLVCKAICKLEIQSVACFFMALSVTCKIWFHFNTTDKAIGYMSYLFKFLSTFVSSHSEAITNKIYEAEKIEQCEKSTSAELCSKNKLVKFVSDLSAVIYTQFYTVCSLWSSFIMGRQSHRLASFRGQTLPPGISACVLAARGLYWDRDSLAIQCIRCQRRVSLSDINNPNRWHNNNCEFSHFRSATYAQSFNVNQESLIHQQITDTRRQNRELETIQNAAGIEETQATPESSDGANRDPVTLLLEGNTRDGPQTPRTLGRSFERPVNAVFNEHSEPHQRAATVEQQYTNYATVSEPVMRSGAENVLSRFAENLIRTESEIHIGQNEGHERCPFESVQSVGIMEGNYADSQQEITITDTSGTGRRRHRGHHSRQRQCCTII